TYSTGSMKVTRSTDNYSGKYCYYVTSTAKGNQQYLTGSSPYTYPYAIAMVVYGSSANATQFDCWGVDAPSGFFTTGGTYGNYTLTAGSDDCSSSDDVTAEKVVSIGAYVTRKAVTTSNSVSYTNSSYTVGDIAPFSSYSTGCGPDGKAYPTISAPGAVLIAGVNRYDTSNYPSSTSSSNADEYMTIVNHSDGSRYGSMSGTSMATPTASGIVALWLQADPTLTPERVKAVMQSSAIKDTYTNGAHAARFGGGKLDALAGLQQLVSCGPTIITSPQSVSFGNVVMDETAQQTLNVKGVNLEGGDITATLTDESGTFALATTTITAIEAAEGNDIAVTFSPKTYGNYQASITLKAEGATDVTVPITATALLRTSEPVMLEADTTQVTANSFVAQWTDETSEANVQSYTLYVSKKPEIPPVQLLLSETFPTSKFNAAGTTNIGSSLNNYMDNSGWTGSYLYLASGGIRFGSSQRAGTLTSPALDLTQSNGKLTVKFTAGTYSSGYSSDTNCSFRVTCGSSSQLFTIPNTTQTDYVVVLDVEAAAGQQVTFATTASRKRVILSHIEIYAGDATQEAASAPRLAIVEAGDSTYRTIEGITAKSYEVSGLTTAGIFDFKVQAHYIDGSTSAWSNEQRVELREREAETWLRGDVNLDGQVNVADLNCLVEVIMGLRPASDFDRRAYINDDDRVDVADINELVAIILGL
ncbi:MAG: S8 family serine peptidase, partial [Muribaculaceae bacterium]|nr:S8 family serine peptidase [Muribaculaceae bacterium]